MVNSIKSKKEFMKSVFFKVLFLVISLLVSSQETTGQSNCGCTDIPDITWGTTSTSVTNASAVVPSGNLSYVCIRVNGRLNLDINLNLNNVTLLM